MGENHNGEEVDGLTQAEREWQEQLNQQWEMEQEQERERQQIRLMMSDVAARDQFDEFSDDDQINHVHLTTLPPVTQVAPEVVPPAMTKKEQKEMEKALKKQKEKEEKERKKQEKERKQQEEKERKLKE